MQIIWAILLPAFAAGLCWLVSWGAVWRDAGRSRGLLGSPPAFAVGYGVAHIVLISWPDLPPVSARDWTFWMAPGMLLLGWTEGYWSRRRASSYPVFFAAAFAAAWFEFGSLRRNQWSVWETMAWIGSLAAVATLTWGCLEYVAVRRTRSGLPAELWLVSAGASLTLVLSSSALLGQLMGGLAAVLGAGVVMGLMFKEFSPGRGGITVFVILFSSLIWQGLLYAEMSLASAILPMVALSLTAVGALAPMRKLSPNALVVIRATLILSVTALGVAIAAVGYFAESGVQDYDY